MEVDVKEEEAAKPSRRSPTKEKSPSKGMKRKVQDKARSGQHVTLQGAKDDGQEHRGRTKVHIQKKGTAPAFIVGLEDMDLKAGDSAAVAGKLAKKRRHRHDGDDPRSLRDTILSRMSTEDDEPSRKSPEDTSKSYR